MEIFRFKASDAICDKNDFSEIVRLSSGNDDTFPIVVMMLKLVIFWRMSKRSHTFDCII